MLAKCSYLVLLVVRDDIYNYIQKPTYMRHSFSTGILLITLVALTACAAIEKGFVTIEARTGDASERFKVDLNGNALKQALNLTQSSLLVLQAKVTLTRCRFHSLTTISSRSLSLSV